MAAISVLIPDFLLDRPAVQIKELIFVGFFKILSVAVTKSVEWLDDK
jgi:hypothetical protein